MVSLPANCGKYEFDDKVTGNCESCAIICDLRVNSEKEDILCLSQCKEYWLQHLQTNTTRQTSCELHSDCHSSDYLKMPFIFSSTMCFFLFICLIIALWFLFKFSHRKNWSNHRTKTDEQKPLYALCDTNQTKCAIEHKKGDQHSETMIGDQLSTSAHQHISVPVSDTSPAPNRTSMGCRSGIPSLERRNETETHAKTELGTLLSTNAAEASAQSTEAKNVNGRTQNRSEDEDWLSQQRSLDRRRNQPPEYIVLQVNPELCCSTVTHPEQYLSQPSDQPQMLYPNLQEIGDQDGTRSRLLDDICGDAKSLQESPDMYVAHNAYVSIVDLRHDQPSRTSSANASEMRRLIIAGTLQRLPFVRQFWWGMEGARVAVAQEDRDTAEDRIRGALRDRDVSHFSFELVSPVDGHYSPC